MLTSNVPTIDSSSSAADAATSRSSAANAIWGVSREETDRQTVISACLR